MAKPLNSPLVEDGDGHALRVTINPRPDRKHLTQPSPAMRLGTSDYHQYGRHRASGTHTRSPRLSRCAAALALASAADAPLRSSMTSDDHPASPLKVALLAAAHQEVGGECVSESVRMKIFYAR